MPDRREPGSAGLPRTRGREGVAHHARLDSIYVSGVERGVRNPAVLVLQELARCSGCERRICSSR
jgi:hypothetical protein